MTEQYGWCGDCRADVPIDAERHCRVQPGHTHAIPPSWGRGTQRWVGGAWVPAIPRPAGYVYKPPAYLAQAAVLADMARRAPARCQGPGCTEIVPRKTGSGTPREYCTRLCRNRAKWVRLKGQRAVQQGVTV